MRLIKFLDGHNVKLTWSDYAALVAFSATAVFEIQHLIIISWAVMQ